MASAGNLQPMPPFDPKMDISTVAQRWQQWLKRFKRYLLAMDIKSKARQRAMLLYAAGPEVEAIFDTLPDNGEDDDFDTACEKLNEYFSPSKNVAFEVYKFRQARQQEHETLDAYYTRLCTLAKTCEFADTNIELKQQIIEGCLSNRLRRKILMEKNFNLSQILDYGRTLARTDQQTKEITKKDNLDSYEEQAHQLKQERRRPSTTGKYPPSSKKSCFRCGMDFPHKEGQKCPAVDKECYQCHKQGHFARVCRRTSHSSSSSKRVHKVLERNPSSPKSSRHSSSDPDSSSEETFTLRQTQQGKHPYSTVWVNGVPMKMMVDSGASVNILGPEDFKLLTKQSKETIFLKKASTKILAFGETNSIPLLGKLDTVIESKHCMTVATIYITASQYGRLLSCKTAQQLKLVKFDINSVSQTVPKQLDPSKKSSPQANTQDHVPSKSPTHEGTQPTKLPTTAPEQGRVSALLEQYADVFEGVGHLKGFEQKLHIDATVPPVAQHYRRIPFNLRPPLEKWLKESQENDLIEPVANKSTEWVSGVVIVPKPKNPDEIRVCGDYRRVNEAIKREYHPMPTIEELTDDMSGAAYFSRLDLRSGYHQIVLKEESRGLTTFTTHKGLFQWKRLPFGINAASEVFQNAIQQALQGLHGVRNIVDDIVVWGRTQTEHDDNLQALLQRLRETGLTAKKSKCLFNMDSLWFYGMILTKNGIKPDQEKVVAIKNTPPPTNVTELRSFLGLVNYCSKFIPNFSTITAPLRKLDRKNIPWRWDANHQEAFEQVKSQLSEQCTLAYYNPNRTTGVVVDASPEGLGAILIQHDEQGVLQVIAFASRALTVVEQRYCQTEREALACVWACEKFHLYLIGCQFTLYTDHQALEILYSAKSKQSARIQRWALRLQQYNYTVKYRPGTGNPADFLSRAPTSNSPDQSVAEEYVNFVAEMAIPRTIQLSEIQEATMKDEELQLVQRALETGRWNDKSISAYVAVREEITTVNGVLLRGQRLIIPYSLRSRTIALAHRGHLGIVKTKQNLRTKVWWPKVDKQAEQHVKECLTCQISGNPEPPPPLAVVSPPIEPWSCVHVDFYGPTPTGEHILVMLDETTGFPEVEIMTKTTAFLTIRAFDKVFARHGLPRTLKSDNGPPFQSQEVKDYLAAYDIHHHRVTPLWPQANGKVEGFMKPMGKAIRGAWAEGRDWQRELFAFLLNYRTTPHSSTGVAPAEMLFKRVIRSTVPSLHQDPKNTVDERVLKKKEKVKQYVDARRHARNSTIKAGDTVLVKQKNKNKYTTMFRSQPYKVIEVRHSRVTAQRGDHVITRNISHFKKYSGVNGDTTVSGHESEDDVTLTEPQVERNNDQDNDQNRIEHRYPLRINRGVPPIFYGR